MNTSMKWMLIAVLVAAPMALAREATESPAPAAKGVRLAVFDLAVEKNAPLTAEALTDSILAICGTMEDVTLVDRAELSRVAQEQKMSLSGLADPGAGVKLGRLVAATHILVGRLSKIGQSYYLVLKVVDVETTEQRLVSVRAPVTDDVGSMIDRAADELAKVLAPQAPPAPENGSLEKLAKKAAWLRGKTVVIDITETHVSRPLVDPAAATAAFHLLRNLSVNAVLPNAPPEGWQEALRSTGKFLDQPADYLLEGEGVSSFAAEMQGMTSCRARVELRLVPVPGRDVLVAERGVGAKVDLVEALAAKAALEDAAEEALKLLIESGGKVHE